MQNLFLLVSGEVIGHVQIYSKSYRHSQVIEAHVVNFTTYKFEGNQCATNVLLAAKRTQLNQAKIYMIELGPVCEGNLALMSRTEVVTWRDAEDGRYDIPVGIECSNELALVFVLSKYGNMYVCDLESGVLISRCPICSDVIFTSYLDYSTQGVIAISRNGQVLLIEIQLAEMISLLNAVPSKQHIAQRLQLVLHERTMNDCDMITRL